MPVLVAVLLLLAWGESAHAIIVLTSDGSPPTPGRNTTAPTGGLADQGWQYAGQLGNYVGTPISSQYFITATHVAGGVSSFTYQGTTYTNFTVAGSQGDLTVFKLGGTDTFSSWAPIDTNSNVVGKSVLMIGRGHKAGNAVTQTTDSNSPIIGWKWGGNDHLTSWGTNNVTSTVRIQGDPTLGQMLYMTFDQSAGVNEGIAADQDSGGTIFINGKLAGIIYAVDGQFSYTATGPYFNAALFDTRGLYVGDAKNHIYIDPSISGPVPAGTYASKLSSAENLAFLGRFVTVPEPASLVLLGLGLAACGGLSLIRRKS